MTSKWLLDGAKRNKQSVTSDWQLVGAPRIEGVNIKEIRSVLVEDGAVTEIFRRDWNLDVGVVDQVFQKLLLPGKVSAWHAHEITTDRLFVSSGQVKIVLYDSREDSPTFQVVQEIILGQSRPGLITVPPKVWHGVQSIGDSSAMILNLVDKAYRYEGPDHWDLPADSAEIPYRFAPLAPSETLSSR